MSGTVKVKPEELTAAIVKEITEYDQSFTDALQAEIMKVMEEAAEELHQTSPKGYRGKYAKSWKVKVLYRSKSDIRVAVHAGREAGLTHLLENGHLVKNQYGYAKRGKKRTEAIPHILTAQEHAQEKLLNKVPVIAKGGGL